MAEDEGKKPRIVVGVDGSESSRHALRWAARQAQLTGADLTGGAAASGAYHCLARGGQKSGSN